MNISELKEGLYIVKSKVNGKTFLTKIVGKFPMLKVIRTVDIEKFDNAKGCEDPLDCKDIENSPEDFEFNKFQNVVLELRKTNATKGLDKYKVFSKKRTVLMNCVASGREEEAITIIASEEGVDIDKAKELLIQFRNNF